MCLVVLKVEPSANSSIEDSRGELRNAATNVLDKVAFRDKTPWNKTFFFCTTANSFVERQSPAWFNPVSVDNLSELLNIRDSSKATRILGCERRNFFDYSQSLEAIDGFSWRSWPIRQYMNLALLFRFECLSYEVSSPMMTTSSAAVRRDDHHTSVSDFKFSFAGTSVTRHERVFERLENQ